MKELLTSPYYKKPYTQQMRRWLNWALPSACALCGVTDGEVICTECDQRFFHYPGHDAQRCVQCAVPLPNAVTTHCGTCLAGLPAFDATIAAVDYLPPIDQLVLALKFGHRLALAPFFAHRLSIKLLPLLQRNAFDCLVAVPLGRQRLSERGFNQAHEIAKPLARRLKIQLASHFLLRQRETQAQAMLPPHERHLNIRQAFTLSNSAVEQVRGWHIGVVDDVMTTGETLNEIAATLKRFGTARVTNLIFARTLPK